MGKKIGRIAKRAIRAEALQKKRVTDLCALLDKHHIKWYRFGEYDRFIRVDACELKHPIHSYYDWEGNPEQDYEITPEQQELLDQLAGMEDILYITECSECCGCGDW